MDDFTPKWNCPCYLRKEAEAKGLAAEPIAFIQNELINLRGAFAS
jgi:hypothetical protein